MPSLRKVFFENNPIFYDAAGRLLLDTLAEELAAQHPPQANALTTELAEAKAEIERLDTECDRQAISRKETEEELAQAKAEIERLRKSAQVYRDRYILALNDRDVAQAELEINNADAEIGRLVRGMRRGTRLKRRFNDGLYEAQAEKATPNPRSRFMDNVKGTVGDDPADALRAIQEVGDGEA